MKVLGYMILHQGVPYLRHALESILPQVDDFVVLYSKDPSQGYFTDMSCPDAREDILRVISGLNVQFIQGIWPHEGAHVEHIWKVLTALETKYDYIVRVDADEIFPPGSVEFFCRQADKLPGTKRFRVPFLHFWRSFNEVCEDAQCPVRIYRADAGMKESEQILPREGFQVFHFGYAIPHYYMLYKWGVSGHRPELRPEWFRDKWIPADPEDCHPVSRGLWNAKSYDRSDLPEIMKTHPYYHLERIT